MLLRTQRASAGVQFRLSSSTRDAPLCYHCCSYRMASINYLWIERPIQVANAGSSPRKEPKTLMLKDRMYCASLALLLPSLGGSPTAHVHPGVLVSGQDRRQSHLSFIMTPTLTSLDAAYTACMMFWFFEEFYYPDLK